MLFNPQVLAELQQTCARYNACLVAVSKTKPVAAIEAVYQTGQRDFGENYVQELSEKAGQLPQDIRWHFIGHLQTNKVKQVVPYAHLIHGVDSKRLLSEINKEAGKSGKMIHCLLQVFIANEATKFGLSESELYSILDQLEAGALPHVQVSGLMGMATNTDEEQVIRAEFRHLKSVFDECKARYPKAAGHFTELSMGMTSDYRIALEEGSTMIRIGSAIFGEREYARK
ncbi:MAG: YggS family pyridoxal phosphate-dependent enzyme [Bacteroidota bacterium]